MKKPLICGLDECGRGCLSGPVVAACVLWNPDLNLPVRDSKQVKVAERERLAALIQMSCPYGIGWVWAFEIDQLNIHHASLLAMRRAYDIMNVPCDLGLADGKFPPPLGIETQAIIKGDTIAPCISAASLVAKVARDEFMQRYSRFEPTYGFHQHKGYATPPHVRVIHTEGFSWIQRKTFRVPNPKA